MVHWHGAAPDSRFSHLAVECNPATNRDTWLEPVDDAAYRAATAPKPSQAKTDDGLPNPLAALASVVAQQSDELLAPLLDAALDAGIPPVEIRETVYQTIPYIGYPRSLNAIACLNEVLPGAK